MRKKYSIKQIEQALMPYDAGRVKKTRLFEVGIDNTNIYVKTDKLEGVLKFYEMYTAKDLAYTRYELSLMERAHKRGLPVPQVLPTKDGKMATTCFGKPVALISFLPGKNIYKKQVPLSFIRRVGEMAAKMDKCFQNFKPAGKERKEHYWDLKRFEDGKKYLSFLRLDTSIDHDIVYAAYDEWVKIIKPAFKKCKKGHIHNDIAAHNILADKNKLTAILDFGDAVHAPLVVEIAVSIAQLCMLQKEWQKAISAFVKAYQKIIPLNKTEKDILYYLAKCRSANMIVICNGLYHSECRHKDFVWFHGWGVKNLMKLEKLGKEGFDKLLI